MNGKGRERQRQRDKTRETQRQTDRHREFPMQSKTVLLCSLWWIEKGQKAGNLEMNILVLFRTSTADTFFDVDQVDHFTRFHPFSPLSACCCRAPWAGHWAVKPSRISFTAGASQRTILLFRSTHLQSLKKNALCNYKHPAAGIYHWSKWIWPSCGMQWFAEYSPVGWRN